MCTEIKCVICDSTADCSMKTCCNLYTNCSFTVLFFAFTFLLSTQLNILNLYLVRRPFLYIIYILQPHSSYGSIALQNSIHMTSLMPVNVFKTLTIHVGRSIKDRSKYSKHIVIFILALLPILRKFFENRLLFDHI
jgi:hypothetical protein